MHTIPASNYQLRILIPLFFLCTRRWYIDKSGIFHANQTSMCFDPHQKYGWGWYRQTYLSPPVIFLLTAPRRCFFCGSFLLFLFCVCLWHTVLSVPCSLVVTCWERADLLALLCVMFFLCLCHFPLWRLVSGVVLVLDCFDSRSLPFSLLLFRSFKKWANTVSKCSDGRSTFCKVNKICPKCVSQYQDR